MDILNQVSRQIQSLQTGDQWIVRAEDLWLSRSDFHALSIYLSREAEKGNFSISTPLMMTVVAENLSLTVLKH